MMQDANTYDLLLRSASGVTGKDVIPKRNLTILGLDIDLHVGNGTSGADNGNVFGITNYKDQNRTQTFTYDALNRLASAQNAGTNCAATVIGGKSEYWGNSYGYDAWGNLLQKSVTKCGAENLLVTADAHNWIHASAPDYQYDAAGNMTSDPTDGVTLSYDQENRITGAAGYTYTYDADGNRVKKSNGTTGTLYWYMTPGIVAESDLAGTLKSEYVFFDGERVARKDFPSNAVSYYFSDHLKTASVITDAAGNIKSESDFYPWGGELQFVNNDSNHYKFTSKERDSETGLDYFGARYYSNGLGRWVSADWSATPVPVPYADFGDPQTLNLYGYVGGNPASKADPNGHCPPCDIEEESLDIALDVVIEHFPKVAQVVGAVAENAGQAAGRAAEVGAVSFGKMFLGVVGIVLTTPQKTGGPDIDQPHDTATDDSKVEAEPAAAAGGSGKKGDKGKDKDTKKQKKDGLPSDTVKLRGRQGYRDKHGNIWKRDMLHKDHWDVTDKKGNKIREVDFSGKQIWPDGKKNKNK